MKSLTVLTLLCTAILLANCAHPMANNRFDPRTSYTGTAEEIRLNFMKVRSGRRISRSDLVPGDGSYKIGAGDILKIEIVEVPNTETTTMIMPDGKLYYDVAPGIPAIGKTIPQLEKTLSDALQDVYPMPIVNINAVRIRSSSYTIMGQVITPGVYQIDKPTNLLDSISLAGGIRSSEVANRTQNLADLRRSVLIRSGKIVPVDFERLIESGDMSQNVYLRPDDYVYLPTKGNEKVYVLGNVRNGRAVPFSSDLTFVRALAYAGGPAPSTFRKGLLVIRGATTTSPQVAPVDLQAILHGKIADFHLQPGDVIWVPRAPWQKLGEYGITAVDSAVSTIALQEASNSGRSESNGNGSLNSTGNNNATSNNSSAGNNSINDVELNLSTGPSAPSTQSVPSTAQ